MERPLPKIATNGPFSSVLWICTECENPCYVFMQNNTVSPVVCILPSEPRTVPWEAVGEIEDVLIRRKKA